MPSNLATGNNHLRTS